MTPSPVRSDEPAAAQLRSAFEARFQEVVRHVASTAEPQVLAEALAAADPVSGLATALASAVALEPPRDPLAAARARSATARTRLLQRAGGALRVGEVAERLQVTPQAIQARRTRGTLLALPQPNGEFVYPVCQFTEGGVLPGLKEVLAAFHEVDPWSQLGVLLAPAQRFGGRTAVELLREGEVESARQIAATYGEHVA